MSFYWRRDHAMIRVNQAAESSPDPLPQLQALQEVLSFAIRVHAFKYVLICSRISPKSDASETESLQTSIVRQQTFLQNCLGNCNVPVQYLVANHVSAFSDDFVDLLLDRLESIGSRTLVLTVAVDRTSRSTQQYDRLKDAAVTDGHGVVSLLWDRTTDLPVTSALRIPPEQSDAPEVLEWESSLRLQRRSPLADIALPLIQPIMWIHDSEDLGSVAIADHASRHIRNSEEWVHAGNLTKYQGDVGVIPQELIKGATRGFTSEMVDSWSGFIEA